MTGLYEIAIRVKDLARTVSEANIDTAVYASYNRL